MTDALNQAGVSNYYVSSLTQSSLTLAINRIGRYVRGEQVRVQLASTNYLSLAEVQVFGGTERKYYSAGGQRIALRENGVLSYLMADHLGSTTVTYRASDGQTLKQLYKPWGEPRYTSGSLATDYTYTGQYATDFGLMFYNARWYDPSDISSIGAFAQEGITATGTRVTPTQRQDIQTLGKRYGCHTCGTMNPGGTWVGDHQPPTILAGGGAQVLYPQCPHCSARQGGLLAHGNTTLINGIWGGAWRVQYTWIPAWMAWDNDEK